LHVSFAKFYASLVEFVFLLSLISFKQQVLTSKKLPHCSVRRGNVLGAKNSKTAGELTALPNSYILYANRAHDV